MKDSTILSEFTRQYGHLKKYGLIILGIGYVSENNVISISTPFVFDRTKLPEKFMGLYLRDGTSEHELPSEFQNIDNEKEYLWAYQRFEEYVDSNANHNRRALDDPNLTREKMLDALCFGDFAKHKQRCVEWENEGIIPKWTKVIRN